MPKLWTIISCAVFGQQLEAIALYLHRSKAAPFDPTIETGQIKRVWQWDVRDLCQLLGSHFVRYNRLGLTDPNSVEELIGLLHCLNNFSAPFLWSIVIDCSEFEEDDFTKDQIFTKGTPLLTPISLRHIGLQCCLPPLGSVNNLFSQQGVFLYKKYRR